MTSAVRSILVLALALAPAACKGGNSRPGEAKLPPATGEGAPPAPALPSLVDEAPASVVAGSETTGTTFPRAHAEVGPPLSGVIASIEVEEGDRVKKGDVLFRLRTTDLALQVQQAKSAVASAAIGTATAQTEYDRAKRLYDQKAVEQATIERAQAQLEAAKAAETQAKVGVSRAQQMAGDAVVRSPIGGLITHKLKNAGEMATMMPPTVVVVVEDHSQLELRYRVPETRLIGLATGQTVIARFGALGIERAAEVTRIAPSVDPATRTVEVLAMIDNRDGALKSGMLATVGGEAAAPPAKAAEATPAKPAPAAPAPKPVEAANAPASAPAAAKPVTR